MICARCRADIQADARFCPACGTPQQEPPGAPIHERRLTRLTANARIAGVCAGIADYLGVDVTLVRAVWLGLSIVPGALVGGVVAYALAWVVMPENAAASVYTGRRLLRSTTDAKLAGVCGGLAEYLGIDATTVRVAWIVLSVLPGCIFGGVVAYLAAWFIVPRGPAAAHAPMATHAA